MLDLVRHLEHQKLPQQKFKLSDHISVKISYLFRGNIVPSIDELAEHRERPRAVLLPEPAEDAQLHVSHAHVDLVELGYLTGLQRLQLGCRLSFQDLIDRGNVVLHPVIDINLLN